MKIGIKIKLAIALSVILAITAGAVGAVLISQQRASLEAQLRSTAAMLTGEFANNSKIPLLQKDALALNLHLKNVLKYPGIIDAYVLGHDFKIESHTLQPNIGTIYENKDLIKNAAGAPPWLIKEKDNVIVYAAPINFKETLVGYSVVSFSEDFIAQHLRQAVLKIIIMIVIVVALIALISWPIASRMLIPIFIVIKGTKEISLGNLDYRIPVDRKDELGELMLSFNGMAEELKKKEILKGVFNRYVSPEVADEILKAPENVTLGGERRDLTVFFADIRGFTSLSRRSTPEDVVEILNMYFTLVTEAAFAFQGTIDKFIGDAVMTVFGSPIKSETHLEDAVQSAFAMRFAVDALNEQREKANLVALKIGIGLDTGTVIVGNMGSSTRMDYTAVGDSINMASRLSDLAKGGDILVTEAVYDRIKKYVDADLLGAHAIKGLDSEPVLYNLTRINGEWLASAKNAADAALEKFGHLDTHSVKNR